MAGILLAVGWLVDINETFGTGLGTSLTTIGGFLTGPAIVMLNWIALREGTPRPGLIGVLLAAVGTIVLVGATSMPVFARAVGEEVRELMEGTKYTVLGIVAILFC